MTNIVNYAYISSDIHASEKTQNFHIYHNLRHRSQQHLTVPYKH